MPVDRARLRRLSARIGRWPRRIAALVCLLLAAASALAPPRRDAPTRPSGLAARLRAGEVAVPVPVSASNAALVRSGDRVGVFAAPDTGPATLVADRLRVLSIRADPDSLGSDPGALVVVAASRSAALDLAQFATGHVVLILDRLP
jgi:hypothetical protein